MADETTFVAHVPELAAVTPTVMTNWNLGGAAVSKAKDEKAVADFPWEAPVASLEERVDRIERVLSRALDIDVAVGEPSPAVEEGADG